MRHRLNSFMKIGGEKLNKWSSSRGSRGSDRSSESIALDLARAGDEYCGCAEWCDNSAALAAGQGAALRVAASRQRIALAFGAHGKAGVNSVNEIRSLGYKE